MKILILCSDNSCLSQMAQGWLQSFDKSLTVCSAGISPAIEVHPLAVQTLASSGIDISHHKPEAVEEYIDEPWDYVITVRRDAEENYPAFTGKVRNLIHTAISTTRHVRKARLNPLLMNFVGSATKSK